jgi:ferritin-like metal-binding protein YciE
MLVLLLYKLKKGVHQMDTLNRVRAEQQARNAVAHEKAMAKSPWIRESVQAYRNATPEQLAQIEAIVAKRAGK